LVIHQIDLYTTHRKSVVFALQRLASKFIVTIQLYSN